VGHAPTHKNPPISKKKKMRKFPFERGVGALSHIKKSACVYFMYDKTFFGFMSFNYTVKKLFDIPSPAGMSLAKLSLGGN
jgi:hypothetical protein